MIILDTSAVIRIASGQRVRPETTSRLDDAVINGEAIHVSAITAWELCFLENRRRTGPTLAGDGAAFFWEAVREMRLTIVPIDADIAIESRLIPEPFHPDPADRFIVATARLRDLLVVTSDDAILDYAAAGHVTAILC